MLEGARFVRTARTLPMFSLVDLGEYPAMLDGGTDSIAGELYDVPFERMPVLDEFEGVPDLFRRAIISLDDGARAYAYLYTGAPDAPASENGQTLPRWSAKKAP